MLELWAGRGRWPPAVSGGWESDAVWWVPEVVPKGVGEAGSIE